MYCPRGDALAAQMARTRPRRRWTEERLRRLGGGRVPSDFSAVCVGARRRSGARPCERCLRVGATDAFGDAHDALGAPRMRRSDAGAANKFDGS